MDLVDLFLSPSYDGTCVVCGRLTDTEVAADGDAEFQISFIVRIGLTHFEAIAMIHEVVVRTRQNPNEDFVGAFRLCTDDAQRAGVDVGVAFEEALPTYRPDDFPPPVRS